MLNQEQRLQDYKTNMDQIEQEANSKNEKDAIEYLRKGFCVKFVANKCFMSTKQVQELKDKIIG